MKINVGDYVRTKGGIIAKCIKEECDRYVFDKIIVEDGYYKDYEYKDVTPRGSYILKSSPNIIDLIKKKDIVIDYKGNMYQVVKVWKGYVFTDKKNEYGQTITLVDYQIKSIVTHEQFEQMKYEVE